MQAADWTEWTAYLGICFCQCICRLETNNELILPQATKCDTSFHQSQRTGQTWQGVCWEGKREGLVEELWGGCSPSKADLDFVLYSPPLCLLSKEPSSLFISVSILLSMLICYSNIQTSTLGKKKKNCNRGFFASPLDHSGLAVKHQEAYIHYLSSYSFLC